MDEILIIDEKTIKAITNISDNMNAKMLRAASFESQEIDLQQIIGTRLLNKLKELVGAEQLFTEENEKYADLWENCKYFLAYDTMTKLCVMTSFKIDNMGLSRTHDENIDYASLNETFKIEDYYQNKTDWFARRLQQFLCAHHAEYVELTANKLDEIRANLYSAATTNVFLGGARGKGRRNCQLRHKYND